MTPISMTLTGQNNWDKWYTDIQALAITHKVWDFVNPEVTTPEPVAEEEYGPIQIAMDWFPLWILDSTEQSIISSYLHGCETPREMLAALKKHFTSPQAPPLQALPKALPSQAPPQALPLQALSTDLTDVTDLDSDSVTDLDSGTATDMDLTDSASTDLTDLTDSIDLMGLTDLMDSTDLTEILMYAVSMHTDPTDLATDLSTHTDLATDLASTRTDSTNFTDLTDSVSTYADLATLCAKLLRTTNLTDYGIGQTFAPPLLLADQRPASTTDPPTGHLTLRPPTACLQTCTISHLNPRSSLELGGCVDREWERPVLARCC